MTEQWDKESKEALIAYRINRTDETLREAELMYNEGHYNGAVNRLYYACYYISMALLLKKGHQGPNSFRSENDDFTSLYLQRNHSQRDRKIFVALI